jgi:hypothetical protein
MALGCFLFFSMLFVPTAYQAAKAVILAAALGLVVAEALSRGRLRLHPRVLAWTGVMTAAGLFFMARGAVSGGPGAFRVGTVHVLWPLAFTLLIGGIRWERDVTRLLRVLAYATVAIGLYTMSYVLHVTGLLPPSLYVELDQGQRIGFYAGFVEYNLYSISTLLFTVPFLFAALVTWPGGPGSPVPRRWLWAAFVPGFVCAVLSCRRALWLAVAAAPLLVLLFHGFAGREVRRVTRARLWKALGAALALSVVLLVYLDRAHDIHPGTLVRVFAEGFDFAGDAGASARGEQFRALLSEWTERPLVGKGLGTYANASIRSDEMLWAYELSYVALLFQTGLLGFLLYASGVGWLFATILKILRAEGETVLGRAAIPLLTGMSGFLIGNATNPYLATFDFMWVIFLPVGIVNHWLLARAAGQSPPSAA